MKLIYATYNQYCNSIDITTFDNMILHIDCNKAEDGLKTTPNSQCALNALAIDNPMEYARLALINEMQAWVDAEDRSGSVVILWVDCYVMAVHPFKNL
mgnify:CR=1 FL=1